MLLSNALTSLFSFLVSHLSFFSANPVAGENENQDVKACGFPWGLLRKGFVIYLFIEWVLLENREQEPVFDFILMNITDPARSLSNLIIRQSCAEVW